ncbi:MAG: hypothetical protein ACLS4B_13785 [Roseburia faecis]
MDFSWFYGFKPKPLKDHSTGLEKEEKNVFMIVKLCVKEVPESCSTDFCHLLAEKKANMSFVI